MNRVKEKVVIVTGAGAVAPGWGNDKATAVLYVREGAKVYAINQNLEAVKETQSIIEEEGGECTIQQVDVSRSEQVKDMVEKCIVTYGRVDILHNNVGIVEVGGPLDISEENWDKLISINL